MANEGVGDLGVRFEHLDSVKDLETAPDVRKKFIGAPYPIIKHPRGFLRTVHGVDSLRADLLSLLLTNPGERVMLPTYGVALRKLIFEPGDTILVEQAREMIVTAIRTWEPRITVESIDITTNPDEELLNVNDDYTQREHILYIQIKFFDPENMAEVQELKLEVPLAGA